MTLTFGTIAADGTGQLTKVHTAAGQTFVHQIVITQSGSVFNIMTDTLTVNFGSGQVYTTNITNLQVVGNQLTGTQNFTRVEPPCIDPFGIFATAPGSLNE